MTVGLALACILVALVLGLVAGWLAWGRAGAAARAERDDMRDRFGRAVADLAGAVGEAKPLREDLADSRRRLDEVHERAVAAEKALAALAAGQRERDSAAEAQIRQLHEAKEALSAQFSEIGGKLLNEAQKAFLERADQRFRQSEEKGEAQLKSLLAPVETTLKRYEEGLGRVEKERVDSYAGLRQAVEQLALGNDVVRRETARLANVMRSSPKARGRWGEEQLRNILESAGLAENVDFVLQSTVSDGERQLRPDCIINLPGGRCIVIDVKCPLVAYEQAYDEEDETRRGSLLLDHARAMKSYAAELGRKGYYRQFDRSPDFVIMYIPGEHFLSAASERAPDLIDAAYRSGVIVASTINMLALAKVMAGMWQQDRLAQEAQQIGELGKELYARLAAMGNHVARLGKNLGSAASAYNDFVGSLETKVLTQAKRFEDYNGAPTGKAIEAMPVIDVAIRPLSKLVASTPAEETALDTATAG